MKEKKYSGMQTIESNPRLAFDETNLKKAIDLAFTQNNNLVKLKRLWKMGPPPQKLRTSRE